MKQFLVDLHIHTLLSPCGDLAMSPEAIVRSAGAAGSDAIAVCDHNTTLQTPEVAELGRKAGLAVFFGAEIITREKVHCAARNLSVQPPRGFMPRIVRSRSFAKHSPGRTGNGS